MRLIETLNLGGKRQLLLVECEGQAFLIGAGGDNVQSIERLSKAEENSATEPRRISSGETAKAGIGTGRVH
jgi:flagellar biogenesis protein FliO